MYLIVGLGNPGKEYNNTRHNTGFMVVNQLAEFTGAAFQPGKGEYWQAKCSLNNADVIVLKPVTYMNNSGIAVQEFLEKHKVAPEKILIVCDDFQLPIGSIRLRPAGTDGGHNGLADRKSVV
jgi:PTH1 family peptidyl-tRNA hydrolase